MHTRLLAQAAVLLFGSAAAVAVTQGPYTYTVAAGQATITSFNKSYAGGLVIARTLGGYPVTGLGTYAFYKCSALTGVTIPDTVRSIGTYAFNGCSSLTSIAVEPGSQYYSSEDGVLLTKDVRTLIRCPGGKTGDYGIPRGVFAIGDYAFDACSGLASVAIPGSVTTIGSFAFQDCAGLTSVVVPDSVTMVGMFAFADCASLSSVTFGDRVTSIDQGAFAACNALRYVYFAGPPPSLGLRAFADGLETICFLADHADEWPSTYAERPAVLWNPVFTDARPATGAVSCTVTGTPTIPIAVEVRGSLLAGTWERLAVTNLPASGSLVFPDSAGGLTRFYRIVGP